MLVLLHSAMASQSAQYRNWFLLGAGIGTCVMYVAMIFAIHGPPLPAVLWGAPAILTTMFIKAEGPALFVCVAGTGLLHGTYATLWRWCYLNNTSPKKVVAIVVAFAAAHAA